MFEAIIGSHAYGTNVETSDVDIRGIFCHPINDRISLYKLPNEISEEKQIDIKFYELEKFMSLLKDCNPNIIEYLWTPQDCIKFCDKRMDLLLLNKKEFITTRAFHTFGGYAFAQIKKMKGQNKWINNPKEESPPMLENYCWFLPINDSVLWIDHNTQNGFCRPIKCKDCHLDLSTCKISSVEHSHNLYRLYKNGSGIIKNNQLVFSSISKDEEFSDFLGLIIIDKDLFEKDKKEHKKYWEWMKNRNPYRWVSQEKGEVDYDVKNAQHCIRLLMSCQSIFTNGEPIVRFKNKQLELLLDIRRGRFAHDHIIEIVEKNMERLENLYKENKVNLPYEPNHKKVNQLFKEIARM